VHIFWPWYVSLYLSVYITLWLVCSNWHSIGFQTWLKSHNNFHVREDIIVAWKGSRDFEIDEGLWIFFTFLEDRFSFTRFAETICNQQSAAAFGWTTLHRYLELTYNLVANFPIQSYHPALNCWWGSLQTMMPTEQPKSITKLFLTQSHTVSKLWRHRDASATSKLNKSNSNPTLQIWFKHKSGGTLYTLQYTAPWSCFYRLHPPTSSPTFSPDVNASLSRKSFSNLLSYLIKCSYHLRCSSFRLSS